MTVHKRNITVGTGGGTKTITVFLEIDIDQICDRLGRRAFSNKSKSAKYLHGWVHVYVGQGETK